jgi:PEP-CTERM motif
MITSYAKIATRLASLCLVATPLAHGSITLIGNGINGGDLDSSTTSNWDPGFRLPPLGAVPDTIEYRTGPGLSPTAGIEWIDSASAEQTQNIVNTNLFNIAPDTLATLQIDFSTWSFGSTTRSEAIVNFYLGTTLLGTIDFGMDTNGTSLWSTYTVSDIPVAAGAGQSFRMDTVTAPGQTPTPGNTLGFALDNLRLTTVPEPSSSLLGLATLGLVIGRRRRA